MSFLNWPFFCTCFYLQVFQQALHRQPNTAAQYLQQMYAAQQQHLMLQTAALQQQHSLSLAAVQQVSKQASQIIHSLSLEMMIAVIVDLLQDMFQKLCITHSVLLPLSTFVIGQYRGWPAKLFTKWHFISANRIYSGYGKCSLECCLPKSLFKLSLSSWIIIEPS